MKVPVSWLREFVDLPDSATDIATRLGGCGFAVESVEDDVIDFEITANRPDCLSVYGLAREAAAAYTRPLRPLPESPRAAIDGLPAIAVTIDDVACGRYALATVRVTIAPSPEWLTSRLVAAGVRPINNVVDVTNYVMLEMGHPMHAFDATRLAGSQIHVRRARAGERLTTLDQETRTLDATMLVIADRDRAVAVAGVMGGALSEVASSTATIALESAWFVPASVRMTGRKLGLKTEASARFERGADIDAPVRALERAVALLVQIGAATGASAVTDVYPATVPPRHVALSRAHVTRLLGDAVPDADVERILSRLGFTLLATPGGWRVAVPTYRVDVAREADLIEEIGRHWGFDRIPATFPALRAMPRPSAPTVDLGRRVRRLLCGAGLQEAVTFTFMEAEWAAAFATSAGSPVIANPLSEKFAVLRPSLLPGLVDALAYSRRRESADVRLFEVGTVFSSTHETTRIGWVLTGSRGEHWSGSAGPVGFTDTKGIAEMLASAFGLTMHVAPADDVPWLAAGARARLMVDGVGAAGWIGRLSAVRGLAATDDVFGGELDLSALTRAAAPTARPIHPIPRQPSIVRDLSIFIDERLPAADVRGTIRSNASAMLVSVAEFDRYQGKGVPEGQISLSLRLTFRDADRTLTDAEVQKAVDAIVAALVQTHGATVRGLKA